MVGLAQILSDSFLLHLFQLCEYLNLAVPTEGEASSIELSTSSGGDYNEEEESLELRADQPFFQDVQIDLNLPRRRMLVEFTCNVCNTRTQRLINPEAYKRGTVFVQCAGCEAYHQLVDNLNLIQEYDFRKDTGTDESQSGLISYEEKFCFNGVIYEPDCAVISETVSNEIVCNNSSLLLKEEVSAYYMDVNLCMPPIGQMTVFCFKNASFTLEMYTFKSNRAFSYVLEVLRVCCRS